MLPEWFFADITHLSDAGVLQRSACRMGRLARALPEKAAGPLWNAAHIGIDYGIRLRMFM
jgi:hypothetical protein